MLSPKKAWFETYRPETIDDLIFPKVEFRKLAKEWIETGQIDGNIFLYGPPGVGKTSLSLILIKSIIKSPADLKHIKSRSVKEIDTISDWITGMPIASPRKIVLIEECDMLSAHSFRELKDKYCEKYQDTVTFILSTNYPHKVDSALLTRFTYQLNFNKMDSNEIFNRVKFILDSEDSKYSDDELKTWLDDHNNIGLRDIINTLQVSHKLNDGYIIFEEVGLNKDVEDKSIGLTMDILRSVLGNVNIKEKKMAYLDPLNSNIALQWKELVDIIHNNYGLDYTRIFEEVDNAIHFQPIKNILKEYIEVIDEKKYPHLHLLGCLSEMIKCIGEITF